MKRTKATGTEVLGEHTQLKVCMYGHEVWTRDAFCPVNRKGPDNVGVRCGQRLVKPPRFM